MPHPKSFITNKIKVISKNGTFDKSANMPKDNTFNAMLGVI